MRRKTWHHDHGMNFSPLLKPKNIMLKIIDYNLHTINSRKSVFLVFNSHHRCKTVKRATTKSLRQECHDYKWELLPWHRRHWLSHGQLWAAGGPVRTRERLIAPGGPTPVFSSSFLQHPKWGYMWISTGLFHKHLPNSPFCFSWNFSVGYIISTLGYHHDKSIDTTQSFVKAHDQYYIPPSIHYFPCISSPWFKPLSVPHFTLMIIYYCYYYFNCSYVWFWVLVKAWEGLLGLFPSSQSPVPI
jgi:hypothetical protein